MEQATALVARKGIVVTSYGFCFRDLKQKICARPDANLGLKQPFEITASLY